MRGNYAAIGGRSPLTDITMAQAAALRTRLGPDFPVAVGMRNWRPFIADALVDLVQQGADRIIGIPLAPQFSTLSVQKYVDAALKALPSSAQFVAVRSFATHPLLLEAFADRVCAARPGSDEEVIFTAHSLPARVIDAGESYAEEVAATARGVAERSGVEKYDIAYQSAGRTPEPWIGPDLSELIRTRAASGGRRFLAIPIGFVCDHTEILFDIDVQASAAARECGATLRRTESLNTSPTFVALLEDLVKGNIQNLRI
jgi:ferrochelatase